MLPSFSLNKTMTATMAKTWPMHGYACHYQHGNDISFTPARDRAGQADVTEHDVDTGTPLPTVPEEAVDYV
jgi:hypothetical protein